MLQLYTEMYKKKKMALKHGQVVNLIHEHFTSSDLNTFYWIFKNQMWHNKHMTQDVMIKDPDGWRETGISALQCLHTPVYIHVCPDFDGI